MSKPKFKVGDKVFVTNDEKELIHVCCPRSYAGQKGEVAMCESGANDALIRFSDGKCWWLYLESLKNISPEKIIIYRNGAEIVAKNTATGKTGVAKCNPADKFDFNIGAKLALERLINSEPEKPKYYTGKVVCVKSETRAFTKGKIYEVVDGEMYPNAGFTDICKYKNFGDVNIFNSSQFIELVE